jgi:hypothetical protein
MTTFIGQVGQPRESVTAAVPDTAPGAALGAPSIVQVCVVDTDFCTGVDPTGAFTLAADVGGDVILVFDGPSFSARLFLAGVPRGATVRIEDIECSIGSGQCHASEVDIITSLNLPPDCSAAIASPSVLWPPDHDMVRIEIVDVFDPDGDPILITATDITQNEAVDEPGTGNTAPDAQLDPLAVRAERGGRGNGRIYAISFVADDGHGGTCAGVVEVCVPHDQGQGSSC